jgi:hypothetical protein
MMHRRSRVLLVSSAPPLPSDCVLLEVPEPEPYLVAASGAAVTANRRGTP